MKVITTFSIDGYELYGKRMVNTWLKYWPSNSQLVVYTEDFNLKEKDPRLIELDLNQSCPNLQLFKDKSNQIQVTDRKQKRHIDKAIRWSHKVYAISHALTNADDYLIFLDGDTYTSNPVKDNLAQRLVQNHLFAVHFEHIKDQLHFETGLLSFNLNHKQMPLLIQELQKGYDNFDIYKLPKAWDGFWFAHLYKMFNLDVLNLGSGSVFSNPLVKGTLHHSVGKKKFNNSSIEYDKYSGRKKQ